jgi:hypothetical protein
VCFARATAGGKHIRLRTHASSVLNRVAAPWLVFNAVARGNGGWMDMREMCTVEPQWLPELAPRMFIDKHAAR